MTSRLFVVVDSQKKETGVFGQSISEENMQEIFVLMRHLNQEKRK